MKILDLIDRLANEQNLEFLLIGGHAINAIGDRRQTCDVDLAVCERDKDKWKALLLEMDYELFNESNAFLQFNPRDIAQWPMDIILVNEQTFTGLKADASAVNLGGSQAILIPSVEHLIAMKLHTLKQGDPIRRLKDLLDIITLARDGQIDIEAEAFKQLCSQYGAEEDYEAIIKLARE